MERLLALILLHSLKGSSQQDKIAQLSVAGFSNLEIANLLQTTAAVVAQSLYAARRQQPVRSRSARKPKRRAHSKG
jgi:predicted transcriptional regulator